MSAQIRHLNDVRCLSGLHHHITPFTVVGADHSEWRQGFVGHELTRRLRTMRRQILSFVGALSIVTVSMTGATVAQEASPESAFANLGLPTLDITVTAEGYEGIPESTEAGRYLVTLTASEDTGEWGAELLSFSRPT